MNTPVCDFVRDYSDRKGIRMHMPGHKGAINSPLGIEHLDITEITDADELFNPSGVILESEKNCSFLFACDTYYSAEGSSLGIRAMLYLCSIRAEKEGFGNKIIAARNCHRTFLTGCALLDIDVDWLVSDSSKSYISSDITAEDVSRILQISLKRDSKLPMAVYLTSPDYAGKMLNIRDIADVCHSYNVPLIVDNAHGAYLKFDGSGLYPIELGSDMCVDSAHKTLPVLTGGAYLHIGEGLMKEYSSMAKDAMVMFASTSPSWIILQSLDFANSIMADEAYRRSLITLGKKLKILKQELTDAGYEITGDEALKISVVPQSLGVGGDILGEYLRENNIEPEFISKDLVVLMLTPSNTDEEINTLKVVLLAFADTVKTSDKPQNIEYPSFKLPEKVMSIREASLCPFEYVDLKDSEGRIAALGNTSCPPAIPIIMPGELITSEEIKSLEFYEYTKVKVIQKYNNIP